VPQALAGLCAGHTAAGPVHRWEIAMTRAAASTSVRSER
jgi:hypothetical protein